LKQQNHRAQLSQHPVKIKIKALLNYLSSYQNAALLTMITFAIII